VSRLVGSPPGYIGYDEGGQLTEAVRRKPYSVLLLDEIEKAHPDVFNILLQILEEGKLTDAQGRRVDFRNTIVIMTSNIGAGQISKNVGLGFSIGEEGGLSYDDMKNRVMGELKKVFRPELLNRIDEIIVFHKLTKEEITTIVDLQMKRVREQMAQHEVTIELTDEAKDLLVEQGYDPAMGARPLRRAIQRVIEDPLADFVLGRSLEPGSTILVSRKRNEDGDPIAEVDITVIPGEVTPEKVTVPPEEPTASADDESGAPDPVEQQRTSDTLAAQVLSRAAAMIDAWRRRPPLRMRAPSAGTRQAAGWASARPAASSGRSSRTSCPRTEAPRHRRSRCCGSRTSRWTRPSGSPPASPSSTVYWAEGSSPPRSCSSAASPASASRRCC
jgi:AAA domain (Cdc48 subfamily)/C-terminal, D2-small domain, of ClpB protein